MQPIQQYLLLLIPLVLVQLILVIAALADLARREQTRGPKWAWVLIILFISFIGPIIYYVFGRNDE